MSCYIAALSGSTPKNLQPKQRYVLRLELACLGANPHWPKACLARNCRIKDNPCQDKQFCSEQIRAFSWTTDKLEKYKAIAHLSFSH